MKQIDKFSIGYFCGMLVILAILVLDITTVWQAFAIGVIGYVVSGFVSGFVDGINEDLAK